METTKLLGTSGERVLSFRELGQVKILKIQDQEQDQLQTGSASDILSEIELIGYYDLFFMDWRRRLVDPWGS